jgi:phage terminase large subunit
MSVNGSEFIFCGLRSNPLEIKSMEGIDIAWVEEAQKVGQESWRILIPTIRGDDSEIWISFNPDSPDDPTFKMFVTQKRDDALVVIVNHEDNPWFPEVLRREMEYDKKYDYQKYLHIWRGEPRIMTDAQVFNGKFEVDNFESKNENEVTYYYGADWGFAQSATALIRCYIFDGFLYVDHEAYSIGTGIEETPKLFDAVPGCRRYTMKADSARPETIKYMNDHGFNVVPTRKGKGSVEDGIEKIRSFKRVIIHERCKHTINEFKLYSYKTDKLTEAVLPILVDAHNHCIDALRYALEDLFWQGSEEIAIGIA